jgi:uncharacterized protein
MGNVERLQEFAEAVNRGDIESVVAALDPDIEWHLAEHSAFYTGEPFRGIDAIREGPFRNIAEHFDGFHTVVERLIDAGDTVVALVRYQGTVKATGKALDAAAVNIFDLRGGKLLKVQQVVDTWETARATGMVNGHRAEASTA